MPRFTARLRGLALLLLIAAAPPLLAAPACDQEASSAGATSERHFVVLAGRSGVFYDRSGPAFVMLIKAGPGQTEIGAVGIYAGDGKQPVFGPVPAGAYEEFLREPRRASDVMLRVEIARPQYERALKVLQTWDRRARERALLYPDISLDNILLVTQATGEINRCTATLAAYQLDWGLDDAISENNPASHIPFEYFKELRRLNEARHVPDEDMPAALLSAADVPHPGSRSNKE